jgi:pimeloyl-ACP methyl ester carboxylesterase
VAVISDVVGSLRRLAGAVRGAPDSDPAGVISYRADGGRAAVVFIHGFGSSGRPFGRFPELLAAEPALAGWDLHAVGYNTGLLPDVRGVWSADPSIPLLANYMRTRARLDPFGGYDGLALVAHSMGGLVVQQALLDDDELADRVSHVFCFGTPSGGVRAARWGSFLKQQVGDMAEDGQFIRELRRRWEERYARQRPFDLWVVAGDRDVFVPATSSLEPFPAETQLVVPGNHLEIVDLKAAGSMSQQVVVQGLVGSAAPAGPWNSARVAVERRDFDRAARELLPHAAELDDRHLVELALALDRTGRRDEAIVLLREHAGKDDTDAKGALGGRLKRVWQAEGRRDDAESALELYAGGLASAAAAGDHEQAYYHAINVAFLELAYRGDRSAAEEAARQALTHCEVARPGHWRAATEGEAHLHLGDREHAVDAYREAVELEPAAHELESAYVQASRVAAELGEPGLQAELDAVFRPQARLPAAGHSGEEGAA